MWTRCIYFYWKSRFFPFCGCTVARVIVWRSVGRVRLVLRWAQCTPFKFTEKGSAGWGGEAFLVLLVPFGDFLKELMEHVLLHLRSRGSLCMRSVSPGKRAVLSLSARVWAGAVMGGWGLHEDGASSSGGRKRCVGEGALAGRQCRPVCWGCFCLWAQPLRLAPPGEAQGLQALDLGTMCFGEKTYTQNQLFLNSSVIATKGFLASTPGFECTVLCPGTRASTHVMACYPLLAVLTGFLLLTGTFRTCL